MLGPLSEWTMRDSLPRLPTRSRIPEKGQSVRPPELQSSARTAAEPSGERCVPSSTGPHSVLKPPHIGDIFDDEHAPRAAQKTVRCRQLAPHAATHALLAMQKVEGSNPFNRSRKGLHLQAFRLFSRLDPLRRSRFDVTTLLASMEMSRSCRWFMDAWDRDVLSRRRRCWVESRQGVAKVERRLSQHTEGRQPAPPRGGARSKARDQDRHAARRRRALPTFGEAYLPAIEAVEL